jgi:hypothetical protein
MTAITSDIIIELRSRLIGLPCWYASAGGKHVGSTFSLALGRQVPRAAPLTNLAHSDEYRKYEGEANLVVWCTWRLDGPSAPESSSDDTEQGIQSALQGLIGSRVVDVVIERPAWDLRLLFWPFHRLQVFCDHVPGEPTVDGNWELHMEDEALYFGPGTAMEVEQR